MGRLKEYAFAKSEELALAFSSYLREQGIDDSEVDADHAWSVVVSKCPEAETVWEAEWVWVRAWLKNENLLTL